MSDAPRKVTLWLAWYVTTVDEEELLRPLRLKMLYASSEDEARVDMQHWLEQRGQTLKSLEYLEPSPYGFQFQFRHEYPGQMAVQKAPAREKPALSADGINQAQDTF